MHPKKGARPCACAKQSSVPRHGHGRSILPHASRAGTPFGRLSRESSFMLGIAVVAACGTFQRVSLQPPDRPTRNGSIHSAASRAARLQSVVYRLVIEPIALLRCYEQSVPHALQLHSLALRAPWPIGSSSTFDIGIARVYPAAAPYCGPPALHL